MAQDQITDPSLNQLAINWNHYKYTSLFDQDPVAASMPDHVNAAVAGLDPNIQHNFDSLASKFPNASKDFLLSGAKMGLNADYPNVEKYISADGIAQLKQDLNNVKNISSTAQKNRGFAENVWNALVYNPIYRPAKAAARVGFAALQYPKEMITAVGRDLYAASHGEGSKVNFGADVLGSTTLGQLIGSTAGAIAGKGPVDTGSGFFIAPESKVGAAQAKAMSAYGRINGQSFTLGRALLNGLGEHPNTTAYKVMSGIVDAVVAVGTDPSTWVGPGSVTKIIRGGKELAAAKSAAKSAMDYKAALEADRTAQEIAQTTKEEKALIKQRVGAEKVVRRTVDNNYLKAEQNIQKTNQSVAASTLSKAEKLVTLGVKGTKTIEGSADIAALTDKQSIGQMVSNIIKDGKQSDTVEKLSRLSSDYDNSGGVFTGIYFDEVPTPGQLHIGTHSYKEYVAAVDKPLDVVDLNKTYADTALKERALETDKRAQLFKNLYDASVDTSLPEVTRGAIADFITNTPVGSSAVKASVDNLIFGDGSETLASIIARANATGNEHLAQIVTDGIQNIWKADAYSNVRSIFGKTGGVVVTNGDKMGARLVSMSDVFANNPLPRISDESLAKLLNNLQQGDKAVADSQAAFDSAKLAKDNIDKNINDISILRDYAAQDPELVKQMINAPENAHLAKLMDLETQIAEKDYFKEFHRAEVGMIDTFGGSVRRDLQKAASYVLGKRFGQIADIVAKETDFARLHRLFGRKLDAEMTQQLVDATTKDEVLSIFLKHLSAPTSDPTVYRSLALKGNALLNSVNTNYKLAAPIDKYLSWGLKKLEETERGFGRYFTRQTVLPLDNLDRLINGVEDWMSSAGISEDVINSTINKISKTTVGEQRSSVVFNALENAQVAIAQKLVPENTQVAEAIRDAFRATGRENAIIKAYFPEKFAKGELPSLALTNGEEFAFGADRAIFEYQFLDDVIKLPDTRDIKNLISKYQDNAITHGSKKALEVFSTEIGDRWRTAQLAFRASYIIRNVGEMQFRQYFSGHESLFNHPLSYIAMIGADPTGKSWQKWLAKNARYSNDILGNRLVGKDLELNAAAAESVQNVLDFIGKSHNSNDPRYAFVGKIYEVIANDNQAYHLALTNTLVRFHSDKLIPLVSRALLDNLDQDAFVAKLIEGNDPKFAGVLKSLIEGGRNGVESGNFAKLFLRNVTKDKVTGYNLAKENFIPENIRTYLFDTNSTGSVARAINNVAGDGEYANSIKQLLADGKALIDGKEVSLPQYKKLGNIADFADEDFALKRRLAELLPKEKMTGSQVIHARDKRFGAQDMAFLNKAVDKFFDISTKIENVVNFAPEYRMSYWDHIGRYVTMASDEALNKLKLEAEKALAPLTVNGKRISLRGHPTLKAIGQELKAREAGKIVDNAIGIDTLNSMAAKKASEYTKNLFYDAAKQRQYANGLRLIFPFAQAQFNTLHKWGQLLKDNPVQFYKLGRAYQALTKPGSSAIYDLTGVKYDENQGFFYKDEYGQERFRYPLAGSVIGAMVGQNIGASSPLQLTAPVQSLNLAAGAVNPMIPGIGVGGQLIYKATGASRALGPEWDAVRKIIFPFGEPQTLEDMVLPSWMKKSVFFGLLNDNKSVDAGVKDWASYLASSGDYGDNPLATDAQRTKLFNDARGISRWTGLMQALFQSIAPATPTQEVFAKDKDGKLRTQALMYQAWDSIAQKHPGDYWASVGEFADTFGAKNILAIIGGSTRAVRGTGDAWSFLNNHPDAADKYATSTGDIVPYFFPGGEAATAYYNWQKVTGRRRILSTEELAAQAENVVYQMAKSQISAQQAAFGYSDYWYSQKIIDLNNQFGGSPPVLDTKIGGAQEKIANVGKALQDPAFKESPVYPETKAFYDAYMSEYKFLQEMRTSASPSLGGKTGYGADVARSLDKYATQLMVHNPAFSRMYYGVFAGQLKVEG
jgi:hypothetical protein